MADITLLCTDENGKEITVTIPPELVAMWQWFVANDLNADGSPKYLYPLNVLYVDVKTYLLPMWQGRYLDGQVRAQVDAARAQIEAVVAGGLDKLTVVGP
jgi:hypothetical protein